MLGRAPAAEAAVILVVLTWWLWPLLNAPAAWLRVTRERLADYDSHLVPYLAIHQSLGSWFWDPLVGYGRPVAGDPLANVFDPVAIVGLILADPQAGMVPVLLMSMALAALAAWALGRDAGCSRLGALIVGLGFVSSGFVMAHLYAGHVEFMLALPALPLAWLGARRLAAGRPGAALITGVAFALPVLAGGAYFAELGGLVLVVVLPVRALPLAWRGHGRLLVGMARRLALAAALAAGLSAIHLLPVLLSEPAIVRPTLNPYGGAQPVPATMRNWLGTKAFYDQPDAGRLLGGPRGLAFDWWESDAYVGPVALALAVLGCLIPTPRPPALWGRGGLGGSVLAARGRRATASAPDFQPPRPRGSTRRKPWRGSAGLAAEALAVTAAALCWVDAEAVWSPFHWLLPRLPNALQLHVTTRALGVTTLSLFLLAGVALTGIQRRTPRPCGSAIALLLGGLCLAGPLLTGRPPLEGQAADARSLHGLVPVLPAAFHVVAIGPTVPQSVVAQHGHVVANAYYPWTMAAEAHLTETTAYADAWLVRRDVGLVLPAQGVGPPARAKDLPPTTPAPSLLLLLPGQPSAHIAATCDGGACAVEPAPRLTEDGNAATLCATASAAVRYRLPIAAAPGWSARQGRRPLPLGSEGGLLILTLPAGGGCAALRYLPPGFAAGAALTSATLLALAVLGWRAHQATTAR